MHNSNLFHGETYEKTYNIEFQAIDSFGKRIPVMGISNDLMHAPGQLLHAVAPVQDPKLIVRQPGRYT